MNDRSFPEQVCGRKSEKTVSGFRFRVSGFLKGKSGRPESEDLSAFSYH